ncbi:site-specific DNA-methyltransferase [Listeria monocytogenes]|uniref:site-specific DNA-methyltransferase n=1 Tax=Listeria monocytogenes TaxID=1639 RepID=UPI000C86DCBC|nr:site-specific DNA-methyltransferase [Listeria monocytogenes]EAK8914823.1 site-specific DNA-methyltransferase [Listeria monocytogenes]EHH9781156.1 site-specific DNA-methyltransferase [Listeria monocytogenes]EJL5247984.1 site-specific DNA-methyltransferase [Listeria monocytogenes]EJL5248336.1 site-specific DNA-methyltransferase [Listeria monocytogenes]EJL5268394.1 site-specific DNA-methyltransferase [Listeria monocytogenes]
MTDNQKKLLNILREMFQFDQSDLDFGIYRIMRMKRDEISRFVDEELPAQISQGLSELAGLDTAAEIAAIDKQIVDTKAAHLSEAIKAAAVAELEENKKAVAGSVNVAAVEADVYNHLTNFFSRYYDDGDFISQRRYKDGAYAIPYEGEEVKLHWANADQYYVKTSEYFKDYTFKTMYGNTVRFKLIEAETDRDNNKANEKRFFQLHTDKQFEVIDDVLYIYVEYKNGGKKNQAECTAEIVSAFVAVQTQTEYQPFSAILSITDNKTLLERQLNRYSARNTFDYFIHKDLGKFLRRELDFYIKNDVIFLDDIDEQDEAKTKEYLTKAKVIRKIARKVIAFLAQIEDFQKKLYLKKKFVVETNYCITLDRVPEELYPEIAANEAQREEWVRLFAIDEIEGTEGDLVNTPTLAYSAPLTIDFMKQNPFIVLDTAFFSAEFKEQLVASIDGLDEKLDGLLIHSENSQALRLLHDKYQEAIKCVYIDPPYNTDASKIIYKNGYEHSSWISLMDTRLVLARKLMSPKSVIELAIDDYEFRYINTLMDQIFGVDNAISNIAIFTNPKGRDQGFIAQAHDYTIMYARDKRFAETNNFILSPEEMAKKFSKTREGEAVRELPLKRTGSGKTRAERPYMFFPFLYHIASEKLSVIPKDECDRIFNPKTKTFDDDFLASLKERYEKSGYAFILPMSEQGEYLRWRWGYSSCVNGTENGALFVKRTRSGYTIYQYDVGDDEATPKSMWFGERYDASSKGTNLLADIIPNNPFDYPKSIFTVEDNLIVGSGDGDIIIDFFAGSATTGHAVINLSRNDNGYRKYILVEMGEYFNTVTKPRIEKVIYSEDWKKGKPVSRKGSSHAFKYMRLESYEDSLNNIVLRGGEHDLFAEAREGYMLSYILGTEAVGSASLLNVEKLDKPFSYKMDITRNLESSECTIDLVETFNYLIGLTVVKNHAIVTYDADFSTGKYGAVAADLKAGDTYKFKAVEGTVPGGDKTLVLWREMTGDIEKDNAALDAYFLSLPNAGSFRRVYVNCDNNLLNLRRNGESWQVVLIDEEMKKRMFEDAE